MPQSMRKLVCLVQIVLIAVPLYAGIKACPNPWAPESGKARYGGGTAATTGITFDGLPSSGELLIYTAKGLLVRRIDFQATSAEWNGKNEDGEDVASGVYLWVVRSSGETQKGKVIVLR